MGVYDIQGINCVFQIKIGSDYKTVVCAKSFTFNTVTDMKETTTVGSGFWKEFRQRKLSYTITFNGMLQVASLTTQEVAKTLFTYQVQFLPLEYQIIYTDNSSNLMVVRGTAYVSSSLFDASPANLVNATQELQGSGPIDVLDQLPQPVNITITSTGDPAIAALIQFKLMNDNGDTIFDSGMLPGASGGDLSHPVNVTGQVQSGSYSLFWQVTANSIGNLFELDAPPTASTIFNDNTTNNTTYGVQEYDFTANRAVTFTLGTLTPPPSCVAPSIPGTPVLPDGQVTIAWATSFTIAGSPPFSLMINNKPSWMSIAIADNGLGTYYVQFTGTPDATGTGVVVDIDITNACGSVNYSDTIDIVAAPVTASVVSWVFVEGGSAGMIRVFKNAAQVVEATDDASGDFPTNAGDVIEVQLFKFLPFIDTFLEVRNVTDTVTLYSDTLVSNQSYSFTIAGGKTYSIYGEINP